MYFLLDSLEHQGSHRQLLHDRCKLQDRWEGIPTHCYPMFFQHKMTLLCILFLEVFQDTWTRCQHTLEDISLDINFRRNLVLWVNTNLHSCNLSNQPHLSTKTHPVDIAFHKQSGLDNIHHLNLMVLVYRWLLVCIQEQSHKLSKILLLLSRRIKQDKHGRLNPLHKRTHCSL